jgi:hypothetical protein
VADKTTKLSIVVRTVDQATAKIRAINARLDAITKPFRDFKKALGDFKEKSGLKAVADGFSTIGSAITSVVSKIAIVGGIAVAAGYGVMQLIDQFDELGDKAERIGVNVDFLAQMRYAAEKSGASVEELDTGLQGFVVSLGQARAGTGRMTAFLKQVSPELLKQLKAAKSNEEAFDLLAAAMTKLKDPAKRAALAQKTVGDAALAPLFARGAEGIKQLRTRYSELAGSQEDAAKKAGIVDDSMKDLHASMDGVKAAIVSGLAPGIKIIVDRLRDWFVAHRGDIAEFADRLGEALPGAVQKVVDAVKVLVSWLQRALEVAKKLIEGVEYVVNLPGKITDDVHLDPAIMAAIEAAKQQQARSNAMPSAIDIFHTRLQAKLDANRAPAAAAQDASTKVDRAAASSRARAATSGGQAATAPPSEAKITIDIAGAPRGTRVHTDPKSTANVDLSVGYQMGGAL